MAANEHPELAFKPHNLQANQLETTQSVALYDAAARLDVEEVKHQLQEGGNPNWYNNPKGGATALHAAAKGQGSEACTVVSLLLAAGAVTEAVTLPEFNTPLNLAANQGNLKSVQLLVEANAGAEQINRSNAFGNTPLHEACIAGHEPVASYLLGKGAKVDAVNKRGSTPLLFAVYGDSPSKALINTLINHGADVQHVDEDGIGIVHVCAIKGHVDLCKMFLDQNLQPKPDMAGNTPAFYATIKNQTAILQLLGEQRE